MFECNQSWAERAHSIDGKNCLGSQVGAVVLSFTLISVDPGAIPAHELRMWIGF